MSVLPNEGNPDGDGDAIAKSASSESKSQPLEVQLAGLNANLDKALKKLDAQDGEIRALKSGKDKAVDRAVGEIQPLKETLARIAKHLNISETDVLEAQRKLVLDDLVNERMGSESLPERTTPGRVESKGNAVELQIIDELLELPTNDSRVVQLKLDHGNDITAYKNAAKKLQQSFAAGNPTPAEQLTPTGASPRPPGSDELTQKYIKDMQAAAGKGARFGDALKDKYRQQGVDVDNIAFKIG